MDVIARTAASKEAGACPAEALDQQRSCGSEKVFEGA
jgi:hypothetical protein